MKQFAKNALQSENFSHLAKLRLIELTNQHWARDKSEALAQLEGIDLNDEQWTVIEFLRNLYLKNGLPRYARTTAIALNKEYKDQGGNKYLYHLFAGGPVEQGSRLANLRTPANACDHSFGSSY